MDNVLHNRLSGLKHAVNGKWRWLSAIKIGSQTRGGSVAKYATLRGPPESSAGQSTLSRMTITRSPRIGVGLFRFAAPGFLASHPSAENAERVGHPKFAGTV